MDILSKDTLDEGLAYLAAQDADLARVVNQHGPPVLRHRPQGFSTLLKIILGQQVSRSSADSTYQRLLDAIGPPRPANFLALDEDSLRSIGFSRQKSRYGRELAAALVEGRLDLDSLGEGEDDSVRATLTALPGIGAWSAEIYLLFALRRPDAWPASDLGVVVGAQKVKNLAATTHPPGVGRNGRVVASLARSRHLHLVARLPDDLSRLSQGLSVPPLPG